MRQIVSLIKDNYIHYGLVDEIDGTLVPFADLLLPNPDRFGLHEAAVLGTNLVQALGLNGHRLPSVVKPVMAELEPPPASKPAPRSKSAAGRQPETERERRNRTAREKYARERGNRVRPSAITSTDVVAMIDKHPEGVSVNDLSWLFGRRTKTNKDPVLQRVKGIAERWHSNADKGNAPMPVAFEMVPGERGRTKRVYYPLAQSPGPRPQSGRRLISFDEVVAVVRQGPPEGMRAPDIAKVITNTETPERWAVKAIENRLTAENGRIKARSDYVSPLRMRNEMGTRGPVRYVTAAPESRSSAPGS